MGIAVVAAVVAAAVVVGHHAHPPIGYTMNVINK